MDRKSKMSGLQQKVEQFCQFRIADGLNAHTLFKRGYPQKSAKPGQK